MARPADTYTHDQFEKIDSTAVGGTVRCRHCKRWQGSAKVLNRKKSPPFQEHLQKCSEYAQWRAAGNGRELTSKNPYERASKNFLSDSKGLVDSSLASAPSIKTSASSIKTTMQRPRPMVDMNRYFDEFVDDNLVNKCVRVRCQSCGFVRTKNETWQAEHLSQCKDFLSTTEGAELLTSGSLAINEQQYQNAAIWTGARPNPDLLVSHHAPNGPRMAPSGSSPRTSPPRTPQLAEAPSLAQHLLAQAEDLLANGTQHTFLSHAGGGMLSESALNQWLTQIGYISRSLVSFTGALIGKIRIPEIDDLERDSTFRCLGFLCSAVNDLKNELEFLEATKRKYGLEVNFDEPKPPTKGFIDLFNSASCPSATLLEGMVMLWATETLFHTSFSYAARFVTQAVPASPPQNPYSLPTSLPTEAPPDPDSAQSKPKDGHTTALREAFIKNWKSENFGRFVDACRSIVDELAMVQPPGNGWDEILACERVFKQAVWLWGQIFHEVMDMEDENKFEDRQKTGESRDHGAIVGNGPTDPFVEVNDGQHAIASTGFL